MTPSPNRSKLDVVKPVVEVGGKCDGGSDGGVGGLSRVRDPTLFLMICLSITPLSAQHCCWSKMLTVVSAMAAL